MEDYTLLVILSLCSSFTTVLGWQLIARAQLNAVSKPGRFWSWTIGGLVLNILSGSLSFAAVQFGPQALAGVLGALPIVFNVMVLGVLECIRPSSHRLSCIQVVFAFLLTACITLASVPFLLIPEQTGLNATTLTEVIHTPGAIVVQVLPVLIAAVLVLFMSPSIPLYAGCAGIFQALLHAYGKIGLVFLFSSVNDTLSAMYIIASLYALVLDIYLLYLSSTRHKDPTQTETHVISTTISALCLSIVISGVIFNDFYLFTPLEWGFFAVGAPLTAVIFVVWLWVDKCKVHSL